MAKKTALLFFITLFLSFFAITANANNANNAPTDSFKKTEEAANNLKNVEKPPIIEDIELIASTIRSIEKTYQSAKTKVANIFAYCKKIIQTANEILGKIKNTGFKIKKYIEDKIDLITLKYKINPILI